MRFSPGAIEEGRKLANKLWNVSRLILQNAEGVEPAFEPTALEERWILARIDAARDSARGGMGRIRLRDSSERPLSPHVRRLLRLVRGGVKRRLYEHEGPAVATALAALERLLGLLHPVMPHVTEEIWSHLPGGPSA